MSDLVYVIVCKDCQNVARIERVNVAWHDDGRASAWEMRCANCGSVFGVQIDAGRIDLGAPWPREHDEAVP